MWETITVYIKYSHVDLLVLVEYEWQSLVKSLLELSTLFIWGIPDTERSGACMQVGHTCFLRNCSSFWWQTGFLRLPRYQSKVTEVIFSQGRRWYYFLITGLLPYYRVFSRTTPALEQRNLRLKGWSCTTVRLLVLTSPISYSQCTNLPVSTLNLPIFICSLHGNLTQKPPSALKPKLIPGLFITIFPCDNIFHLFKLLLFLAFLPFFLLSVFVGSNLRFHCIAEPCQALLVSSSQPGSPVGP